MVIFSPDDEFNTLDEVLKCFHATTDFGQVSNLQALLKEALAFFELVFTKLLDPETGDAIYADPCSFLAFHWWNSKASLLELQAEVLEGAKRNCCMGTPPPPEKDHANLLINVPPVPPPGSHSKHAVALWQLGYNEACHVCGSPSLRNCLDVLTSTMVGEPEGLKTRRCNIEIIFDLGVPGQPGPENSEIQPFSVYTSEGGATTCGCFLLIYFVMQFNLRSVLPRDLWESLCPRLLTNLVLHAHYEPAETLQKQVHRSIANQCANASLQGLLVLRPTIWNMFFAFGRLIASTPGSWLGPQTDCKLSPESL